MEQYEKGYFVTDGAKEMFLDIKPAKTLVLLEKDGKEFWLNFVGDKLEAGGDLPIDEAAKVFFDEVIKISKIYGEKND